MLYWRIYVSLGLSELMVLSYDSSMACLTVHVRHEGLSNSSSAVEAATAKHHSVHIVQRLTFTWNIFRSKPGTPDSIEHSDLM